MNFVKRQAVLLKVAATAALAAGLAFPAGSAFAQAAAPAADNKPKVEVRLVHQKVTRAADGKEVLAAADRAIPGETIEYRATYSNTGRTAARQVLGTLPVPTNMEYVADSSKPQPQQAALADGNFSAIPLKRKVRQPNGQEVEVIVPQSEYRALRWNLGDLGTNQSQTVAARMRVAVDVAATAPATPAKAAPGATTTAPAKKG
jgi:uncharacterized repeat protein (TIGR01451 family)